MIVFSSFSWRIFTYSFFICICSIFLFSFSSFSFAQVTATVVGATVSESAPGTRTSDDDDNNSNNDNDFLNQTDTGSEGLLHQNDTNPNDDDFLDTSDSLSDESVEMPGVSSYIRNYVPPYNTSDRIAYVADSLSPISLGILGLSLLPFALQFSLYKTIFSSLPIALLSMFFLRRSRFLGYIFDVHTGMPILGARITLHNEKGKVVKEFLTNKFGGYVFPNVKPGTYSISVFKKGYEIAQPERNIGITYANSYYGGTFTVSKKKSVFFYIPVFKDGFSLNMRLPQQFFSFNLVTSIIFIAGFLFSIVVFFVSPNIFNGFILALYIITSTLRTFAVLTASPSGYVRDISGMVARGLRIQLFDTNKKKFIGQTIVDSTGQYSFLTNPGKYAIEMIVKDGRLLEFPVVQKKPRSLGKDINIR